MNETSMTANELVEAANVAFVQGDLPLARGHLERACRLEPDNAQLILAIGHFKMSAGDVAGALANYERAVVLQPNLASAQSSRALALQLCGRSGDAWESAANALALKPTDLVALKVLARIALNAGRADDAERICERITQIQADDTDARRMREQCYARRLAVSEGLAEMMRSRQQISSEMASVPVSGLPQNADRNRAASLPAAR